MADSPKETGLFWALFVSQHQLSAGNGDMSENISWT